MHAADESFILKMPELWAKLRFTNVDINSEMTVYGATAVHETARVGNTEALQLLLRWGGDPNRANMNVETSVYESFGVMHATGNLLLDGNQLRTVPESKGQV